jgi:AcrR family transcriptional regulator
VTSPDETPQDARPPQLQDRVTKAITGAFFAELADVGYGQMSIESIVRRARVGKAAVYRRWPGKKAMAIGLISDVAVRADETPDTGSFRGDVLALTGQMARLLSHPLASRIIPAVAAEAGREPELESVLRDTIEGPRREKYAQIVRRGIERQELPTNCDIDLALDLLVGPLYWRLLVRRQQLSAQDMERFTDGVVAAISATQLSP